jgi:protocatechuate 3,4-dioxygenase beta subunit
MKGVALATAIFSAVALTAFAQQTVRLSGRVLNDSGDPVPNARVAIVAAGSSGNVTLTDRDGQFTLAAPPGRVTLSATKTSYSRAETTTENGKPIEFRLVRGAAISGRVVNERGEPVMGASVFIEKASGGLEATTFTDDRGEYRLGGVASGTFTLAVAATGAPVRLTDGQNQVLFTNERRTIYYPGVTTRTEAEPIRLQPGDNTTATDFVAAGAQSIGQAMMTALLIPNGPRAPDASMPKTGVIRGRTVTSDGRPVAHALVRAVSRPAAPGRPPAAFATVTVTADDDGRFELPDLPAGSFQITASKVGYAMPDSPSPFAPPPLGVGPTVDLADGETRERVDINMARWSAVNGRIFDVLGDPLQGVSVQLLQVRYQAGRRRLVAAGAASNPSDDLGRFRVSTVQPGRYIVSATVGGVSTGELPGYARAYYPGTANAGEAEFVTVALSQEQSGIEFSLSRARTATISGTLLNAAGEPSTMGSVKLMPSQRSGSVTSIQVGARLMKDGKFEFPNVTPGQYVIQVDRGRRNSSTEGEFGILPVAVDGVDLTDLTLQTSSGSSISGRVSFDAYLGTTVPTPGQIEISPVPIDPDLSPAAPANADVHADWRFEVHGINGPRRLQLQRAPAQWTLKEIRVNGLDATDRPIAFGKPDQSLTDVEVVLTDRISAISASVADDHGRPAAAKVIVFSPDRDRWYASSRFLRVASTNAEGVAGFAALPAGSYYAAAVAQLPSDGDDAWQDPAYLESLLAHATAFTLGEGQKQVLSLKLSDR